MQTNLHSPVLFWDLRMEFYRGHPFLVSGLASWNSLGHGDDGVPGPSLVCLRLRDESDPVWGPLLESCSGQKS